MYIIKNSGTISPYVCGGCVPEYWTIMWNMVKQDDFAWELTAISESLASKDPASKTNVNPSWGNICWIFGHYSFLVLKRNNVKRGLSVYVYCVPWPLG
jgi:hypothetical protein